jgi:signal transduction histidine kinase/ActR/RegA family two-component response regulator
MAVVRMLLTPVLSGQEAMFLLLVPVLAVAWIGGQGAVLSSAGTAMALVALSPFPEHSVAGAWLYRVLFAAFTLALTTAVAALSMRARRANAYASRLGLVQHLTEPGLARLDLDALLDRLLERLLRALPADAASVLLMDEERSGFVVGAARGVEQGLRPGARVPVRGGFAGQVTTMRKPLMFDECDAALATGAGAAGASLRSLVGIPLMRQGQVVGVLQAGSLRPRAFGSEHVEILQSVAERTALAVEHARVDEAARNERELAESATRAKDAFLDTVSHELRTPLNVMLGWVWRLREETLSPQTIGRAVAALERNIAQQTRLIEELIDVARAESGRMQLEIRQVDLSAAVEAALETVGPAAEAKGIEVVSRIDSDAGPILGDLNRLQQVVWHLLGNAVKFTPVGGRVEVDVRRAGVRVRLSVRDTGMGISPEFQPRLFGPFSQADHSATRVHGGLGLGLAITRRLVEAHGGTIRAESEGADRGATFVVELPVPAIMDQPAWTARAQGRRPPGPRLDGVHVLVVEDQPDALEAVMLVLEAHGARVVGAGSSAEALARLHEARPDVMLADIAMPVSDGYELIEAVRAQPETAALPAAALTAYDDAEHRDRALAAGYQAHLRKPVQAEALARAVADLFRGSANTETRH